MKAKEILQELDAYTEDYNFPILDNYNVDLAQCRITVFSDKEKWLIVFEVVGIDINQEITTDLYIYSNVTRQRGLLTGIEDIVTLENNENWYDDEGNFIVNPFHLELMIMGKKVKLNPEKTEYIKLGINTESFNLTKLLRYLNSQYEEELWLSIESLLIEIDESIELPLFYQSSEWQHPDISDGQKPSESMFFQSLSQAIESNNVDLIKSGESNTHWSNWTWSDFENQEENME